MPTLLLVVGTEFAIMILMEPKVVMGTYGTNSNGKVGIQIQV